MRSIPLSTLSLYVFTGGLTGGLTRALAAAPLRAHPSLQEGSQAKPPSAPPPLPVSRDSAGQPVVAALKPGELPAAATSEARAAWEQVCRGNLSSGEPVTAPVTAFVLDLDVRYRGGPNRSNDVKAVYSFLAPAFVRVAIEGRRDALRGPEGDWLVDHARKEKIHLSVDRVYAEDRRQLDETLGIAKTFLALTDPRSLRIAALATLPGPPASLPAAIAKRASELAWLSVSSPDFRLIGSGATAPLFRAALGADRKTGYVEFALVEEDLPGALRTSARLVQLISPKPVQGFLVPQQILVYSPEQGVTPLAFAVPSGMDLWIKKADLRAPLLPESFRP